MLCGDDSRLAAQHYKHEFLPDTEVMLRLSTTLMLDGGVGSKAGLSHRKLGLRGVHSTRAVDRRQVKPLPDRFHNNIPSE